jgi:protein FAM32A
VVLASKRPTLKMSSSYGRIVGGALKLKDSSKNGAKLRTGKVKKTNKDARKLHCVPPSSSAIPASSFEPLLQVAQNESDSTMPAKQLADRHTNESSYFEETSVAASTSDETDLFRKFVEESRLSKMTSAEKSFYLSQKRRQWERIQKSASKSHKEKVESFNRYLNSLSEHFDIPRVGPG